VAELTPNCRRTLAWRGSDALTFLLSAPATRRKRLPGKNVGQDADVAA